MKRSAKSSRPTGGNCYTVAAEIVLGYTRIEFPTHCLPTSMVLCHGSPTGQGPIAGVVHGHAWVEVQNYMTGSWVVIDKSNGKNVVMDALAYYAIGKIEADKVWKYTRNEVRANLLLHKHYGPWEQDTEE